MATQRPRCGDDLKLNPSTAASINALATSHSSPMRTTILIVVFTSLCLSVPTSAVQSTSFRLTAVHRNQPYVTNGHPRQTLDLYLPTPPAVRTWEKPPANGYQTKLPLVIWIFGGGFLVGSKDDTVPLELLSQGYAVASIGYQRTIRRFSSFMVTRTNSFPTIKVNCSKRR